MARQKMPFLLFSLFRDHFMVKQKKMVVYGLSLWQIIVVDIVIQDAGAVHREMALHQRNKEDEYGRYQEDYLCGGFFGL